MLLKLLSIKLAHLEAEASDTFRRKKRSFAGVCKTSVPLGFRHFATNARSVLPKTSAP